MNSDVGNRIARILDADGAGGGGETAEYFVYNGDNVLVEYTDADAAGGTYSPALAQRHLHGLGADEILASDNLSGSVLWALADHEGSVRDVISYNSGTDTATVENHIQYNSFGEIVDETYPAVEFRFSYTGREYDEDVDLYYYRARWYDASVGRFISEDPAGYDAGDMNLYRYVGNNPMILTDPSGLCWSGTNGGYTSGSPTLYEGYTNYLNTNYTNLSAGPSLTTPSYSGSDYFSTSSLLNDMNSSMYSSTNTGYFNPQDWQSSPRITTMVSNYETWHPQAGKFIDTPYVAEVREDPSAPVSMVSWGWTRPASEMYDAHNVAIYEMRAGNPDIVKGYIPEIGNRYVEVQNTFGQPGWHDNLIERHAKNVNFEMSEMGHSEATAHLKATAWDLLSILGPGSIVEGATRTSYAGSDSRLMKEGEAWMHMGVGVVQTASWIIPATKSAIKYHGAPGVNSFRYISPEKAKIALMQKADYVSFAKRAKALGLVENPNRPGSWGTYNKNGKFIETGRVDVFQPGEPGYSGKTHIHIEGSKKHLPTSTKLPGE